MRKVYICSPYRATDSAQLDRNIDYAQELTRQAIKAGLAPITPHLYMTQCLDENKREERAAGMAAGLELLKMCDFVIAGVRYGISEGMSEEIRTADALGIEVVNADKLHYKLKCEKTQAEKLAADSARVHIEENELNKYRYFKVHEPKERQIMALPFYDRVVQHAKKERRHRTKAQIVAGFIRKNAKKRS